MCLPWILNNVNYIIQPFLATFVLWIFFFHLYIYIYYRPYGSKAVIQTGQNQFQWKQINSQYGSFADSTSSIDSNEFEKRHNRELFQQDWFNSR